jgi:hypothetical protein
MKIIRVLWGSSERILSEIPKKPLFKNEEVFVYGISNRKYLEDLGYKCRLLCTYETLPLYSDALTHFAHKLEALKVAELLYEEYLFLDWDITLNKKIDDKFYGLIREGGNIQCPLYSYSPTFYSEMKEHHIQLKNWTPNLELFLKTQTESLEQYSWEYLGNRVLPCFCFFYSRNSKIINTLLTLHRDRKLNTCIEEFSLYLFANCTLKEYIRNYEPKVLRGKEETQKIKSMGNSATMLNRYISTFVEKDIYLLHDIL